jgi:protein-tyrosine phosphatase
VKILFVCTGNTCRSCMAETIFNELSDIDGVKAYSAGISVVPQSKTSRNTATLVKSNFNVDISERKAIQLTSDLIKENDLILTMTSHMRDVLLENFPQYKNKIHTLNQFVGLGEDVVDPYGSAIEMYKTTFDMLKKSIELLLIKTREDNGNAY